MASFPATCFPPTINQFRRDWVRYKIGNITTLFNLPDFITATNNLLQVPQPNIVAHRQTHAQKLTKLKDYSDRRQIGEMSIFVVINLTVNIW